jgi:XapX domain-containing protein
MKVALGFALAFALGFVCRAFGIPSPAPPVLVGALLVLAMTCGYVLVDRFVARQPARHARNCAGPTGRPPSHDPVKTS